MVLSAMWRWCHTLGLPLSRLSIEEIRQHVISQDLVAEISGATLWRWLGSDALRPWQHRSWIFPARSEVRRQSRTHPRSLPTRLVGLSTGPRRLYHFRRRKDQHSGSSPETADFHP